MGFIALTKTNQSIFLIILALLSLLYINYIHQTIKKNVDAKDAKEEPDKTFNVSDKIFNFIEDNSANIKKLIIGLLVVGFVLYLGEKKYE